MAATLDWMGCATFRLTLDNQVVMLDAYIDRVPSAAPTGATVDAIRQADWIVVGHSHFDHLYGAERIAKNTGAKIIGSYESIRIMAAQGVPEEQFLPVDGGETARLSADVTVTVYPSQHSCVWSADPLPASDAVCIGELGVTYQEQQEKLHLSPSRPRCSARGASSSATTTTGCPAFPARSKPRQSRQKWLAALRTPSWSSWAI